MKVSITLLDNHTEENVTIEGTYQKLSDIKRTGCIVAPKLFVPDPDLTFQKVSDPDPVATLQITPRQYHFRLISVL
jgi:hypothetical protein